MNLTPVVITGIVFLLVGIAIGSLLSGLNKDTSEESSPQTVDEGEWVECVSLVSDKEGKEIFPKFDGEVIKQKDELPPRHRETLVKALGAVNKWLGEPVSEPPAVIQKTPLPEAAPPVATDTSVVSPEIFIKPAAPPPAKISMNPIDFLTKALQSDVKTVKPAPKSIVAQIDEILQEKLLGTPMEKRGVRLVEFPNQGMVVLIGLDKYEGVDEVPDEEIRQLIRSAVKEWEARFESS